MTNPTITVIKCANAVELNVVISTLDLKITTVTKLCKYPIQVYKIILSEFKLISYQLQIYDKFYQIFSFWRSEITSAHTVIYIIPNNFLWTTAAVLNNVKLVCCLGFSICHSMCTRVYVQVISSGLVVMRNE